MSATLEIRGLAELQEALRQLPDYLGSHGAAIVEQHGREAQAAIIAAYPKGPTGNLKQGVKLIVKHTGVHGATVQVRSSAHHAWLWEHGRSRWGQISDPPAPVFIPVMERTRRSMYTQLAALMRNAGLTVVQG